MTTCGWVVILHCSAPDFDTAGTKGMFQSHKWMLEFHFIIQRGQEYDQEPSMYGKMKVWRKDRSLLLNGNTSVSG